MFYAVCSKVTVHCQYFDSSEIIQRIWGVAKMCYISVLNNNNQFGKIWT